MNLRILCRVENTSITPKVYGIYMNCAAKQCNTPSGNGSHGRFKGKRKCSRCPACDLYITTDSRYNGKPVRKGKYSQATYEKLYNSILDGTVHSVVLSTAKTEESK